MSRFIWLVLALVAVFGCSENTTDTSNNPEDISKIKSNNELLAKKAAESVVVQLDLVESDAVEIEESHGSLKEDKSSLSQETVPLNMALKENVSLSDSQRDDIASNVINFDENQSQSILDSTKNTVLTESSHSSGGGESIIEDRNVAQGVASNTSIVPADITASNEIPESLLESVGPEDELPASTSSPAKTGWIRQKATVFSGTQVSSESSAIIVEGESVKTKENKAVIGLNLLINDVDTSGGKLNLLSFTQSKAGGVVELGSNGLINYMPPKGFHGIDWFDYVVSNDRGGSKSGRVNVTVSKFNESPLARPDVVKILQHSEKEIDVLANDSGLDDGVEISVWNSPSHGSLSVINGKFLYAPINGYTGNDTFAYKVTDADGDISISTVTIYVECTLDCSSQFKLSLSWAPSPSKNVVGYMLYVGNKPDDFADVIYVGNSTSYEYIAHGKGDFYFALTALNAHYKESSLSQVVKKTL